MKKTLSILLCAVLMIAFGTVVGCAKPEQPFRVNLLNDANWKDANKESTDNNDNAGKTVYEFSKSGENKFNPVKVTKLTEWDALKLNLADKDLKSAKKLVISIKSNKDTECIVKLISSPSIEPKHEIKFGVSSTEKTYEFDLSFEGYAPVRAGLTTLEIIAASGDGTFTGDITISKLEFNAEAPIKDNVLNEENKDLVLPYDGVSPTYDVIQGWKVNSNDVDNYAITQEANKFTVDVKPKAGGWQHIFKAISGNMQEIKKLTVVIKGKADTRVLLKLENNIEAVVEKWVDLDGTEQTIVWDLLPANLPKDASKTTKLIIFASPDTAVTEQYSLEVSKMEFAK